MKLVLFNPSNKHVKIADIGSGPLSIIGSFVPGMNSKIYHSDKQDFSSFYKKHSITPLIEVEYQDMEKLTYPDDYFDVVHCANALDHTKLAEQAVMEMIRVCKPGGWIYITCNLDQMDTGHKHYWNAKQGGVFTNGKQSFDLKVVGFETKLIDNGGESRYNKIIALYQKDRPI